METITLRELCLKNDLSNDMVLEFEKYGLIEAVEKIEGCYRTYPKETSTTIRMIKIYQKIGFSLNEIKRILKLSQDKVKLALENQVVWLEQHKMKVESAIRLANELITVRI